MMLTFLLTKVENQTDIDFLNELIEKSKKNTDIYYEDFHNMIERHKVEDYLYKFPNRPVQTISMNNTDTMINSNLYQ